MKLAIMQPYFFPYIGYYQLINAVDKFIFYDDVNFIKGGWINRNRILIDGKSKYINILMKGASSNKIIKEINVITKSNDKIIKTISQNYKKAPYYDMVMVLLENYFQLLTEDMPISIVAGKSIEITSDYLGLNKIFEYSSEEYSSTKKLNRTERIIEIVKSNNANTYVNAGGGKELYSKEYFSKKGINLNFMKSNINEYNQFNNTFTPYLSIIDIMMFNSPEKIRMMLQNFDYE